MKTKILNPYFLIAVVFCMVISCSYISNNKPKLYLTVEIDTEKLKENNPGITPEEVDAAVVRSAEIIKKRINAIGGAGSAVLRAGKNKLKIDILGIDDAELVKEIIERPGKLEFKVANDDIVYRGKETIIPEGYEVLEQIKKAPDGSYMKPDYIVVKAAPELTGEYLKSADLNFNSLNMPYITIKFNAEGQKLFDRITRENLKKQLAIVVDGKIISAPVIQAVITGGSAVIEGEFTLEEAKYLSAVLSAGPLSAPASVTEIKKIQLSE